MSGDFSPSLLSVFQVGSKLLTPGLLLIESVTQLETDK